jgi:hypothetical protein
VLSMIQKYGQFLAGRLENLDRSDIRFFEFIERNPDFISDFANLALDRIIAGKTKYRASAIMARLRWDYEARYVDRKCPVLLNDHYTPKIARLLVECEVIPEGFFEFRDQSRRKDLREAFTMRAAMDGELITHND